MCKAYFAMAATCRRLRVASGRPIMTRPPACRCRSSDRASSGDFVGLRVGHHRQAVASPSQRPSRSSGTARCKTAAPSTWSVQIRVYRWGNAWVSRIARISDCGLGSEATRHISADPQSAVRILLKPLPARPHHPIVDPRVRPGIPRWVARGQHRERQQQGSERHAGGGAREPIGGRQHHHQPQRRAPEHPAEAAGHAAVVAIFLRPHANVKHQANDA